MNRSLTLGLTLAAGVGIGAVAVQVLHAQVKPPAFFIVEVTVNNQDGYVKEFAPAIDKTQQEYGCKYLARGGKTLSFFGEPAKPRAVLIQCDSLEKLQAWQDAPATKAAMQIGSKYSTQRGYAVEGLSP